MAALIENRHHELHPEEAKAEDPEDEDLMVEEDGEPMAEEVPEKKDHTEDAPDKTPKPQNPKTPKPQFNRLLLLLVKQLDEALEVCSLIVKLLDLDVSSLLVHLLRVFHPVRYDLDLALELHHLCFQLHLLLFQHLDLVLQLLLPSFRHGLLPDAKIYCRSVQSLVSGDRHLDLISHSQQQKPSLRLINGDLSDDLIKALREEFLSDRADATLTSLALHQLLVQQLTQSGHVNARGLLMAHILAVVLAILDPFSRR